MPLDVTVVNPSIIDVTVVNPSIIDVTVVNPSIIDLVVAPTQIKGDKGDDGQNFSSVEFAITTPSSTWLINHNKNYLPTVTVLDLFNRVVLAEIEHVSINQVKIYFSSVQAGKIILT